MTSEQTIASSIQGGDFNSLIAAFSNLSIDSVPRRKLGEWLHLVNIPWAGLRKESYAESARIFRFLASQGAPVDFRDEEGDSFLYRLMCHNTLGSVTQEERAFFEPGSETEASHMEAYERFVELVEAVTLSGADPNLMYTSLHEEGVTPLWQAVFGKDRRIVEILLRAGADPNLGEDFTCPLVIASLKKEKRLVALLLQYGADPG